MIVGEVVGSLWATRKDEKLNGLTFLVVKPHSYDENTSKECFVAADHAGAGIGDTVLVTKGSAARSSMKDQNVPIDAVIVGIVDSLEMNDE
ncbi:EutN/CcmL family microcompartment protein [Brevibacillus sp. 7WMA2]|uniref:Carbon dioxide concentrating mechanism protein CcmL n=3 Tax=Brevibacillus TaxID=55080 RepID=A0A075R6B3_BRELA|nr:MULTISPECIES: EutN/CcmL family microcompartment protein [Brevibacillus]HAS00562.1 ethanolamine utilization protein EutN [Brevibacillus sp.]AIG26991.1 carbon dioxide concentrating mechanism protein CcmL [Brevibacillus laterosporus LMG 15441]AKF96099.1 ethanolamine utilization protein EutN [Brevibacillus laterosporus]AUM65408.1 ethanolamine utilization protein EutN [Brevibacillus laterosporus]AYK08412.1 ethanolamine utilization protein EutN [Brevibacillus laterosporus]